MKRRTALHRAGDTPRQRALYKTDRAVSFSPVGIEVHGSTCPEFCKRPGVPTCTISRLCPSISTHEIRIASVWRYAAQLAFRGAKMLCAATEPAQHRMN